jgi:selenocysteine-specific elongation factor
VVVVTRSDLADPSAALARSRAEVDRTSLADAPAVVVSGHTGAGLDDLRSALVDVLRQVRPDPDADARIWVDRVFPVAGAGTVVTGTLPAGTVSTGDVLALGEEQVRVRGIESLGRQRDAVSGAARVALRLGGHAPAGLARGAVLVAPERFEPATEIDVRLHGTGQPPQRPLLHVGSARVAVHLRPLGQHHARLRLPHPLPLRHGDRVVLRDPGSRALWGADVLDAVPPPLARRGAAAARADLLEIWGAETADEVARRGVVRRSLLDRLGVTGPTPDDSLVVGDWLVSATQAADWRSALTDVVRRSPDGLSPAAAGRPLGIPDADLVAALVEPPVRMQHGRLVVESDLPAPVREALDAVRDDLTEMPFAAPDAERLAALGLDRATLARLARAGHLLVVGDGIVLLPGADSAAYDVLAGLPQPFSTGQAREALGTSRRVVLPLLGHLDRTGRTVRLPDDTRRVAHADVAAG